MGNPFRHYIHSRKVWACCKCDTHLTDNGGIVSKQFQGLHGRGFLFSTAMNVYTGKQEHRTLRSGPHIVCDIFCKTCDQGLGWKYIKAYAPSEHYKEDKYLLERARITREGGWAETHGAQES